MLAHAFRVGIGVRPTPLFGATHAALAQAFAHRPRIRRAAFAGILHELLVPLQFFGNREVCIGRRLAEGEVPVDLRFFGNVSVAFARDVARRNVDELRIEQLHQLNQMFRAVDVWLDRFVHRRIEVDHAGQVHDHVHLALEFFKAIRRNATQRFIEVALDDGDFSANHFFAAHVFYGCPQGW